MDGGWLDGGVGGWMEGSIDGCMGRCMGGWIDSYPQCGNIVNNNVIISLQSDTS